MQSFISPFTRTPGVAGKAFIETHFAEEIIANFESAESYKYVYKIVGLRGSGKSVEYSRVMEHFRGEDKWLVYALSAGGNPLNTLISMLSRAPFIDENQNYYSAEAALKEMLTQAKANGFRVLIGIDDIAKSDHMVEFLSIIGTVLMEPDKDVRFLCTGISKNIKEFVTVPHLSFFVRNESIVIKPLDLYAVSARYRELLGASKEDAARLAQFTEGYAYAYQVLGEICFKTGKTTIDREILDRFDEAMAPQYDLIWGTLTEAEKELVRIIVSGSGLVKEIREKMEKPSGFTSLRDRLIKKHLLLAEQRGKVTVPLPRFREYVDLWQ